MKDVLLLHDNAQPHSGLRTRETVAKLWRSALPRPAHRPDLAPSDCHLFGPVKAAVRGRHFADDSKLKQSLCDVGQSRGREFYGIGIQRVTQRWQNCVENDGHSVEK
jgi:transposase